MYTPESAYRYAKAQQKKGDTSLNWGKYVRQYEEEAYEERRKERVAQAAREKIKASKVRAFARRHGLTLEEAELTFED